MTREIQVPVMQFAVLQSELSCVFSVSGGLYPRNWLTHLLTYCCCVPAGVMLQCTMQIGSSRFSGQCPVEYLNSGTDDNLIESVLLSQERRSGIWSLGGEASGDDYVVPWGRSVGFTNNRLHKSSHCSRLSRSSAPPQSLWLLDISLFL